MLYESYQAQNDILAPVRLIAEACRGFLDQPWPLVGNAPFVRTAAAAMELLSNAGMSHHRPEFGIRTITIEGKEVGITEEIADAIVRRGVLDKGLFFLQKPFTPDVLAAKVREVLDEGR